MLPHPGRFKTELFFDQKILGLDFKTGAGERPAVDKWQCCRVSDQWQPRYDCPALDAREDGLFREGRYSERSRPRLYSIID